MGIFDLINGLLGVFGSFFILISIVKLQREKLVRGVSWIHVSFFTGWGYWSLFYYPHLGQWFSFWGVVAIVIANTYWIGQLIYFQYKESK